MEQRKNNADMPRGPWQNSIQYSLAICLLVPVVLAITLRVFYTYDAAILAISGIVPVLWVAVLLIRRRRVDWLGVIVAACFYASLAASTFAGVSSLPLKIYHPVVTATVGVFFLVSYAVRRPMLTLIIRTYNISGPDHIERLENPKVQKRLSRRTALVGLIFVAEAAAHAALSPLPTDTYLEFSGVVTVAVILVLITVIRLAARHR